MKIRPFSMSTSNGTKSMKNQKMKFDPQVVFGLSKRMNGLDHDLGAQKSLEK